MRIVFTLSIAVIAFVFCSCEKSSDMAATPQTGKGGSLAKFTIVGNYIYAVSSHFLYTVDISDPANPVNVGKSKINFEMETIYPYKNRLFIGSRTGLYIYSIDTAASPRLMGEARHARSCDPVVANDSVSYSTLKGGSRCGPATSGLYVHDVKDLSQPALKKTIPINEPLGLGLADSALYVCCASEGLKVFSLNNAYEPKEVKTISGADFIDVIPYGDLLICWQKDGISLYDISNRLQPVFVKKIES